MSKTIETDLIRRCQQQELAAQAQLYHLYIDRLYYVVLRYVNDHQFTENILQDVFVKVFNYIHTYDENKGAFSTWINTIAVREALNHCRKKKIYFQQLEVVDARPRPENDSTEVLAQLEAEDILKIIAEMPEKYRMVFNLYVVDGYSHKEIGEMLDIQESSSRSCLSRAKKILQNLLLKHFGKEISRHGKLRK